MGKVKFESSFLAQKKLTIIEAFEKLDMKVEENILEIKKCRCSYDWIIASNIKIKKKDYSRMSLMIIPYKYFKIEFIETSPFLYNQIDK